MRKTRMKTEEKWNDRRGRRRKSGRRGRRKHMLICDTEDEGGRVGEAEEEKKEDGRWRK